MNDVRNFTSKSKRGKQLDAAIIYDIVRYCEKGQDAEFAEKHSIAISSVRSIRNGNRYKFHPSAIQARKDHD